MSSESDKNDAASTGTEEGAAPVSFPEVEARQTNQAEAPLDRVYDLTVPVTVELGRTSLSVQDVLKLAPGAVVELDHPSETPVNLYVHGKRVAKGEIVVVSDFYAIRITSVGD
jgi:flagellar motor switch protein FliN/FliY